MAQWTNDRWVSTMHRVVNPPPDRAGAVLRQGVPRAIVDRLVRAPEIGDGFDQGHQAFMRSKWNYVMPGLPQQFR